MTEDKITLTREQFEDWRNQNGVVVTTYDHSCDFDSLRAHVSKPKRREWWIDGSPMEVIGTWNYLSMPTSPTAVHVREVFPNDIGPYTKEEARRWVLDAWHSNMWDSVEIRESLPGFLKALGLGE